MTLVKLTSSPNGEAVYISPAWVQRVRECVPAEPGETHIMLSGGEQCVREGLEDVVRLLAPAATPAEIVIERMERGAAQAQAEHEH